MVISPASQAAALPHLPRILPPVDKEELYVVIATFLTDGPDRP